MYYTKSYGWVTRAEHLALIRAEHTFENKHKKKPTYSRNVPAINLHKNKRRCGDVT